MMDARQHELAKSCKGFLDDEEGLRLHDLAKQQASMGPVLEVGSYCGKSALYIGAGVKAAGGTLICLDHHRGSEEHQPGEQYHDASLFDAELGRMDSLLELRRNLARAELESHAMLLVTTSQQASKIWSTPLAMVFIDGGHSHAQAHADYEGWHGKLMPGGILAIHDLFPDPATGGQAPIEIYRRALLSGLFEELPSTKTLGVLRRKL